MIRPDDNNRQSVVDAVVEELSLAYADEKLDNGLTVKQSVTVLDEAIGSHYFGHLTIEEYANDVIEKIDTINSGEYLKNRCGLDMSHQWFFEWSKENEKAFLDMVQKCANADSSGAYAVSDILVAHNLESLL